MCIACREMKQKSELIRIVKSPKGVVTPDLTTKMPGRGAYICKNKACFERAEKSNAIARAFKMATPKDIWAELKEYE